MNERIKELVLQSQLVYETTDGKVYNSWEDYVDLTEYVEKFAELIVRECISVMDNTAKEAQENFTYMDNDVPTTAHQFEIRKHFGVEK